MKKIILCSILFVSVLSVSAQSLERFVIASAGDYQPVGSINICFTVGELAAVESFLANPLMHLTQGFEQPDASYKGIQTITPSENSFGLFPNPAKERVGIHYEGLTDGKLRIRLFNVLGQQLKSVEFYQQIGQLDYLLDLSGISQGLYLIELSGKRSGAEFRETSKLNVIN